MTDLATRLRGAAVRPSLIVIAEEDIYVPSSSCEAAAADLGSAVVRFPDQGHWWMIGAAAAAADALVEFWAGLAERPLHGRAARRHPEPHMTEMHPFIPQLADSPTLGVLRPISTTGCSRTALSCSAPTSTTTSP